MAFLPFGVDMAILVSEVLIVFLFLLFYEHDLLAHLSRLVRARHAGMSGTQHHDIKVPCFLGLEAIDTRIGAPLGIGGASAHRRTGRPASSTASGFGAARRFIRSPRRRGRVRRARRCRSAARQSQHGQGAGSSSTHQKAASRQRAALKPLCRACPSVIST